MGEIRICSRTVIGIDESSHPRTNCNRNRVRVRVRVRDPPLTQRVKPSHKHMVGD